MSGVRHQTSFRKITTTISAKNVIMGEYHQGIACKVGPCEYSRMTATHTFVIPDYSAKIIIS